MQCYLMHESEGLALRWEVWWRFLCSILVNDSPNGILPGRHILHCELVDELQWFWRFLLEVSAGWLRWSRKKTTKLER